MKLSFYSCGEPSVRPPNKDAASPMKRIAELSLFKLIEPRDTGLAHDKGDTASIGPGEGVFSASSAASGIVAQ